jgi:xyloglucan-specific endo-beta-1,4-glucanase
VNIAGFNWDLYVGPNGSMKVFSFIPTDGSWKLSFNADVKLFFNWLAANQGYPINQQNLIGKSNLGEDGEEELLTLFV